MSYCLSYCLSYLLLLSGKTNNEVKDGLKAQKHIAQGIALGKHYIPTSPSALKGQKPNY